MAEAPTPVEVFCSYAHEDDAWRQKLETHMSLLKRQGLVSLWYDRLIPLGTDRTRAIDRHLETASVILLLISPDFIASDYCYGVEMQRALERHADGTACVIPILLRPVDWHGAPFAHLECLPRDARPITLWPNQDEAFLEIAGGIRTAIESLENTTGLRIASDVYQVTQPAFLFNQPLTGPQEFFGRARERNWLIYSMSHGGSTSIVGPRRIGKTWLLSYLRFVASKEIGPNTRIGYLNPYLPTFATEMGFVAEALKALGMPTSIIPRKDLHLDILMDFVHELLVEKQLPVLLIDGFDGLLTQPEPYVSNSFLQLLRSIGNSGLCYVITSKRSLRDITNDAIGDSHSAFLNLFSQLLLEPFSKKEAEEFAQAKRVAAGFNDQEYTFLLEHGQGGKGQWPPLRLQLVGKMLQEDKILASRGEISPYLLDDPKYVREFKKSLKQKYENLIL